MAVSSSDDRGPAARGPVRAFVDMYTKGLTTEEFQRLFTRDTRDAYRYFARRIDHEELARVPWYRRPFLFLRGFFLAFTLKMSPARRVLFSGALVLALLGLVQLADGIHIEWIPIDPFVMRLPMPMPEWPAGTDLLVLYSDGITEAEDPKGRPFDEDGLRTLVGAHTNSTLPDLGKAIFSTVQRHAQDVRFADDLTVLLARRPVLPKAPDAAGPADGVS